MDPEAVRNRLEEIRRDMAGLEIAVRYGADVSGQVAALKAEEQALLQQVNALGGMVSAAPLEKEIAAWSVSITGNVDHAVIITGDGNRVEVSFEELGGLCLRGYLRALAEECSDLPLGIIDPNLSPSSLRQPNLRLPDVYTDLDVSMVPREGKGRQAQWSMKLVRGEGEGRTPLLTVAGDPKLASFVLLGDAGSGKTSFVNYLTFRLARAVLGERWEGMPEVLAGRVPLRLVLRKLARQIGANEKCGTARMIWDGLRASMGDLVGPDAGHYALLALREALGNGNCLILLDGLDEVPEAGRRRACLLEAIQAFLKPFGKKNRVILTGRPYAYANPDWQLEGLPVVLLEAYNRDQVGRFVERWYTAAQIVFHWDAIETRARIQGLLEVLDERVYLADLASRPLLLTLIASLNASQKRLPEDRADLYEQSVRLLLTQWQRQSLVEGADGKPIVEYGVGRVLGMDESALRRGLAQLAYEMHEQQGRENGSPDLPADIPLGKILEVFSQYTPEDLNTKELVEYLDRRSGLLIAREKGVYAFPHRSFQEYLAACDLTKGSDKLKRIKDLAEGELGWWREVLLLAIGRTSLLGAGNALEPLNALLPAGPEEMAQILERHWRVAVLVGMALLELRLLERAADDDLAPILKSRAQRWLVRLVEEGRLSPRERAEAGDVLGRMGDPRFDSARLGLPVLYRGKPEEFYGFVRVEAGPFLMGSQKGDKEADGDEFGNPETLNIPYDYWIARYPVTVGQFALFVDAQGYEQTAWWSPTGWDWRKGRYDSKAPEYLKDWLKRRSPEKRGEPYWWAEQLRAPTRPVMGVSWFEACAYAKWLDNRLREVEWFAMPGGYALRLPTEAEWEKAARGADGRRYPWGSQDWDASKANIGESEINHPSVVGMYPDGAALGEIFDLSGNVWEWTSSRYQAYPYQPQSKRDDTDESAVRTTRGGSWGSGPGLARCASRYWFNPDLFNIDIGFRPVLSLADAGF